VPKFVAADPVELELPAAVVAGMPRLFVIIDIKPVP
jgi:hypothetical protein